MQRMLHKREGMSELDCILLLEDGDASSDEEVQAMQRLIDSGIVWKLQGSYGRAAERLISQGLCHLPPVRLNAKENAL